MKTIDDNGYVHDYSNVKNFITDGFCSELTNRYSCYNCQYNGISRKVDFTIGDLWGITCMNLSITMESPC